MEDQYGVGDRVQLLDVSGVVINVGMRITTIRDDSGVLWYLRNGEILKVGNHSQ
jgi:small-conductance mechanosensitive channel